MIKRIIQTLFTIAIATSAVAQQQHSFGDDNTVCFIGNSITQAGTYHLVLQTYHATRHPNEVVKFISCGTGGDNAAHITERMDTDILIHNPDYAFLMTGMNDMYAELFKPDIVVNSEIEAKREECLNTYMELTEALVEKLTKLGIDLTLMTPTIYDQTAQIESPSYFGKSDALEKCAKHIRNLSKRYNTKVVEFTPIMLKINKQEQKKDPSFTIVGQDRVHPLDCGHFVMAHQIISTVLGDEIVSTVEINAKKGGVEVADNCEVEYLGGDDAIIFDVKANALPFPLKSSFEPALKYVPFMEDNNQERLAVKGLKGERYTLSIGGQVVDTLSSKELHKGVNLATNRLTPQYQQAQKVFELCSEYNKRQSLLRIIANIDYKSLKEYSGDIEDLVAMRAFLDEVAERSRGESWYEFAKQKTAQYFEIKPHQAEYWEQMDEIRNEIFSSNKPSKLRYELRELK